MNTRKKLDSLTIQFIIEYYHADIGYPKFLQHIIFDIASRENFQHPFFNLKFKSEFAPEKPTTSRSGQLFRKTG